ncbi:pyridoxamine 5'-phosphate oxidase family protein [Janibacter anophelis]|uniref:pyridoxamine 5'-phosphate oxidase family protein n=1 Tax=Janibacter anophelis TaxID=319054 RepID=UPI0008309FF9|nr:pyridoxamine 5'-phosphate oxidase family protein [Janibacter anophelis]
MGKVHPEITPRLQEFIEAQPVFFVATAPLSADGHVNVSPKGIAGTSVVVDASTFAYLDITASGAETIAHLRENGRVTVMFCAFDGKPNIVRLHGRGRVVTPSDDEFATWAPRFDLADSPASRAVIVVDVARVSDSCGFGVPLMEHRGERDILVGYMERKGADGVREYQQAKNRTSIDGLPAIDA